MADLVSVDEVSEFMYKLVKDSAGMKKWKATDLHKACEEQYGDGYKKRKNGKEAIKKLVDEGQLVYTYFGGSFLEVPHKEGASND